METVDEDALPELVLKPEDLPAAFQQFDEGPLQMVDQPVSDQGWKARYRRSGTPATRGALVVDSRAELFDDDDEAGAAFRSASRARGGAVAVAAPDLGDEAAARRVREEAVSPVDVFTVVWRDGNVVGWVTVSGFSGKVTVGDAVGLARKQERRIERARS